MWMRKRNLYNLDSAQCTDEKATSSLLVLHWQNLTLDGDSEATIHDWIAIFVEPESSCSVSAPTKVAARRKLRPRRFAIQKFEQCSEKMNEITDLSPDEQGKVLCCCD